jgi:hypothetical protein
MKKLTVLATLFFIALFAQSSIGQEKKVSTPEEKATFVKGTRLLEQQPFRKDAKELNQALLFWLVQAPDVSVTLCSDFINTKKYKYSPEVTTQFTYGMGAFIIENPEKAKDEKAVYKAGIESVTRMYEAILVEKPKAVNDLLDKLLEKRKKDELGQYVEEILKNGGCKSK